MSHPFVLYYLATAEIEEAHRQARSAATSTRTGWLSRSRRRSAQPAEITATVVEQADDRVPSLV